MTRRRPLLIEDNRDVIGELDWLPASARLDLVAEPVGAALSPEAKVVEIDPDLADTAAFCERYGVPLAVSANCVIIAARRGGTVSHAACVVLAVDRIDVNGRVRRHLGARKASFAPVEEATALTGMEYGGITPVGLPGWPVLVDGAVVRQPYVVVGSGLRRSKLLVPGTTLAELPSAEIVALRQSAL